MYSNVEISKARIAIIIVFTIFIILPLSLSIIFALIPETKIPEEEALSSNVEQEIINFINDEIDFDGSGGESIIMHQIATENGYTAVQVNSISPDNFGNGMLVIVRKKNDEYKIIYNGTDYSKKILQNLNIPSKIIDAVDDKESLQSKYSDAIYESKINPRNRYPIIQYLPYISDNLRITYAFNDDYKDTDGVNIPVIDIYGDATGRKVALRKIRKLGFDPGDYHIEFSSFVNPITEEIIPYHIRDRHDIPEN